MYSPTKFIRGVALGWLPGLLSLACGQSTGTAGEGGSAGQSSESSHTSSAPDDAGASSSTVGSTAGSSGGSGSSSGGAASSDASGSGSSSSGSAATGDGAATDNGCEPSDAGAVTASIDNTGPWNDTSGTHIQAHGGGFIKVCDTWYWFGEDKALNTNGTGNFHAISCYASKDLMHWEHRNKVVTTSTAAVLNNPSLIIERPKVVYNASTKLYVMWAHWDMESCPGASGGYCDSEAVVFTSPTVDGNYTYVGHFQPQGDGSRDCTLWQEPDGTAYFVSTGGPGGNAAGDFHDTELYQLSSDYLTVKSATKIWASDTREAYAFWRFNGKYYGISSAQTGWAPNQAAYFNLHWHARRAVEQQLYACGCEQLDLELSAHVRDSDRGHPDHDVHLRIRHMEFRQPEPVDVPVAAIHLRWHDLALELLRSMVHRPRDGHRDNALTTGRL